MVKRFSKWIQKDSWRRIRSNYIRKEIEKDYNPSWQCIMSQYLNVKILGSIKQHYSPF